MITGMVAPLQTGVIEDLDRRLDEEPRTGEPIAAHIVKSDGGDAVARVVEARVYGTPLEALCGVVFVPQRDPTRLPMCGTCKDIYETYRAFNEGLPESPKS
jgi:hypothetical protein